MRITLPLPATTIAGRLRPGHRLPIEVGAATHIVQVLAVRRRPWLRGQLLVAVDLPIRPGWGRVEGQTVLRYHLAAGEPPD